MPRMDQHHTAVIVGVGVAVLAAWIGAGVAIFTAFMAAKNPRAHFDFAESARRIRTMPVRARGRR